jgi:hypothetical protein
VLAQILRSPLGYPLNQHFEHCAGLMLWQIGGMVPEPLEAAGDTVAYEFIRMPDSTGFGDYTETGQVIPVRFRAADGAVQEGGYVHANDPRRFALLWRLRRTFVTASRIAGFHRGVFPKQATYPARCASVSLNSLAH